MKTIEKPLEKPVKQNVDGKAIQADFIRTTMKNITEHSLQLSFCREGSKEYEYHVNAIADERASLKNYGN